MRVKQLCQTCGQACEPRHGVEHNRIEVLEFGSLEFAAWQDQSIWLGIAGRTEQASGFASHALFAL